ncbi:acyl-CoA dehydrogenase family protein [Mesorhizobium sp. M0520]|uniref:acyl-CoA dehydrogenase family protein n=1 Tax=Mesorhizobium sp. M0520 TaxID=2956957 RepID=UPI0033365F9D
MDFTLTEEQTLLRESARRYFADATQKASHRGDRGKAWADIVQMGWLSVVIPTELGGFGGSIIDGCLLARELGRGHIGVPFAESAILGAKTFANDPRMLEQIAQGQVKPAYALQDDAEPLTFQRRDGGYILLGAKPFVRFASDTNMLIVKAFDEVKNVPAVFGLSKDSPALKLDSYPTLDGIGATSLAFESHVIGDDSCLAIGEAAHKLIDGLELAMCLAFSAEAVGLMEFLVDATVNILRCAPSLGSH